MLIFTLACPNDPALGGNYEHTYGGEAPGFTSTGSGDMISYQSDGAHFRVEKTNDAPTITSNFYIMWGKLNVVLRAAPGAGIISSMVLLSDVLDEIDWVCYIFPLWIFNADFLTRSGLGV